MGYFEGALFNCVLRDNYIFFDSHKIDHKIVRTSDQVALL